MRSTCQNGIGNMIMVYNKVLKEKCNRNSCEGSGLRRFLSNMLFHGSVLGYPKQGCPKIPFEKKKKCPFLSAQRIHVWYTYLPTIFTIKINH